MAAQIDHLMLVSNRVVFFRLVMQLMIQRCRRSKITIIPWEYQPFLNIMFCCQAAGDYSVFVVGTSTLLFARAVLCLAACVCAHHAWRQLFGGGRTQHSVNRRRRRRAGHHARSSVRPAVVSARENCQLSIANCDCHT